MVSDHRIWMYRGRSRGDPYIPSRICTNFFQSILVASSQIRFFFGYRLLASPADPEFRRKHASRVATFGKGAVEGSDRPWSPSLAEDFVSTNHTDRSVQVEEFVVEARIRTAVGSPSSVTVCPRTPGLLTVAVTIRPAWGASTASQ